MTNQTDPTREPGGVLKQSKRKATLEGWAFMRRDDWNVPSNLWVAESPNDQSSGIHLDTVLEGLGIPVHRILDSEKWKRVKITIEVEP